MHDALEGLLIRQRLAAEASLNQNTLIIAQPGSGKTFLIVRAVRNLLNKTPNASVCLVTFTNASTAEMASRIKGVLSAEQFNQVKVINFSKLILEMIDRSKFNLAIGAEQFTLILRAINLTGLEYRTDQAYQIIEHYGRMLDPHSSKDDSDKWSLFEAYEKICLRERKFDLNMITKLVIQNLHEGKIQPLNFTHWFIDEYQDTDQLQIAFMRAHIERFFTVVCDDDQSIYGFRGVGGYESVQAFQKIFKAQKFVLNRCMRCKSKILKAAEQVIQLNQKREDKDLIANIQGGVVEHYIFEDIEDELLGVVEHVTSGGNWGVIARNNLLLDKVEAKLLSMNIPVQRLSGSKLFDKYEVQMLLHILNYLLSLSGRNLTSVSCLDSLSQVMVYLSESESTIIEVTKVASENSDFVDIRTLEGLDLCLNLYKLAKLSSDLSYNIDEFIKQFLEFVSEIKPGKFETSVSKDFRFAQSIMAILKDSLLGDTASRCKALCSNLDRKKQSLEIDRNCVQLATFHASKGLEFENVFLLSLNDGVIPSEEDLDLIGYEEERRILYTGITRAIEKVVFSSSGKVSKFLTESFPDIYQQNVVLSKRNLFSNI